MKSVGILTFHITNNHGTALQCYALRTAIKNISGYSVHVIPHTYCDRIINGFGEPYLYDQYENKIALFEDFFHKEIGCQEKPIHILTADNAPKYDFYVVGSDTVWHTAQTGSDAAYFLDFVNQEHSDSVKIAYAPSLGVNDYSLLNIDLFDEYIDKFDYLSVREALDIDFIKQFTNKNVCRVLDPTFLLTAETYLKLIDKKAEEKGYILLYLLYDDSERIQKIINFANRLSLEKDLNVIHHIYNIPPYVFGDRGKSFAFDGPKDFLRYVSNADLIITNSFHGLAFSIIFRKPFYVSLRRLYGATKLQSVLEELHLEHRVFSDEITLEYIDFNLDYRQAEETLDELRQESYEYLKKSLKLD